MRENVSHGEPDPTDDAGGGRSPSPLRQGLSTVAALGSVAGAVAAVAQILDYGVNLASTLWISVGTVLTIGPTVIAAVYFALRRSWRNLALVTLTLVLVAGGVGIVGWQLGTLIGPDCDDEDRDEISGRYSYPRVLDDTGDIDLEYCRVDVNEGRPLHSQYTLRGKLFGTVPKGHVIALIVQPDPDSCDTLGQRGSGNYFLRQEIRFDGRIASWDRSDNYGYPQAVTLKHHHYYVLTVRAALEEMRTHRETHTRNGRYHGIEYIPEPSRKLAVFSIQGKSEDAKPCA